MQEDQRPEPVGAPLDRRSPVPLYHQLEQALLELIVGSGMTPDARFPSESELSAHFGVTRPTVRQALDRLVQVGVLRRERGRGTYVAAVPNARAERTSAGQGPIMKVVMPSLTDLLHLRVLAGVVDQAHDEGMQVILAHSDGRRSSQERELAGAGESAGVLLWPVGGAGRSEALDGLRESGMPIVQMDRYVDPRDDHVVLEDVSGASAMTAHLVEQGHRRIAFVHNEPVRISSVRNRLLGYRRTLASNGLPYDELLVRRVNLRDPEAMAGLLDEYRSLSAPPTATFCANDVVAVRLFGELRRRSARVPGDHSVAGFDALEALPSTDVLTSVRRPTEHMGRRAVSLLADRVLGRVTDAEPRHVTLPTELRIGDTTGPPRRKGDQAKAPAAVRRA